MHGPQNVKSFWILENLHGIFAPIASSDNDVLMKLQLKLKFPANILTYLHHHNRHQCLRGPLQPQCVCN